MSAKGVFITGTDTGVGKSIVAATLARLLRDRGIDVGVMKPVTSGCRMENGRLVSDDAELLAWGAGLPVDADIAPFLLRQPIAPSEAAYQDGKRVSFRLIGEAFGRLAAGHDFVIVEGAGGLMVPLDGELLIADLINYLRLPLLVVAGAALGTINHTLLTCFSARQLGIAVCGVIINDYPERPGFAEHSAPQLIGSLAGAPLLGVFPHVAADDTRLVVAGLEAGIAADPSTEVLLRGVGAI
ncbi:MAG TPA: dethiobiotin synthase [Geobacteraceae bacterium]